MVWHQGEDGSHIDASLYREIQNIVDSEQKPAQDRDWPEIPISNVVEMILHKRARAIPQRS